MKFTNKKNLLSISLAGVLAFSISTNAFAQNWYDGAVKFAKEKNIISNQFNAEDKVTKLQGLRAIYLLNNKDTNDDAITKWALDSKIISSKDELNNKITRSEFAQIVKNYGDAFNIKVSNKKTVSTFKDFKEINSNYIDALNYTLNANLIVGDTSKSINPNQNLKQSELLNIVMNLSKFNKKDLLSIETKVKEIEKYGHASLDMTISEFMNDYGFEFGDTIDVITSNGFEVKNIPFLDNYYVDRGEYMLRAYNGHETIAICINYGKFNEVAKVKPEDTITIKLNTKAGALALYEMNQLERTNSREDYKSDEVYANFRPISMGKLGTSALFRSSSPINNEINRASYADTLIKANGINAVLNLADNDIDIANHLAKEDFNSPYYKSLIDKGNVKINGLSVNYAGADFSKKLVEGLKFFTTHDGPYHVHCNEGKDRAGFTSALLEALMGGTSDEIINDYMKSYENYYNLEKGEKYDIIINGNIKDMLRIIGNVDKTVDLSKVDLSIGAKKYLLDNGMNKEQVNKLISNLSKDYKTTLNEKIVNGNVESVSKYGNVTTTVTTEEFKNAGFEPGDIINVKISGHELNVPFGDTYSNVDNKKEVIVPDTKNGKIVIAINMGDFSKTYSAIDNAQFQFAMGEKGGYKEEYEIRSIDKYRTNERKDYSSNEVFANFRPIIMGKIQPNILYRTSSPINPEIGRSKYANDLIEQHGILTVINMADSKEELENYFTLDSFKSPYYKSLYEKGQVKYLNMGVDFTSEDFNTKLKSGLEFLSKQQAPFAVHCNEGKDRAGFISIVLEGLMGGTVDEIREDYMISYINYYFVEKDSKQYNKIADSNVMKSLKMIANVKTDEDLRKVNLSEKTEAYLKNTIKLDDETIENIKKVLSTPISTEKAA